MKICILEHPRIPSKKRFNDIANTPLWSCLMGGYAASALENSGFHTTFLDAVALSLSFEETQEKILNLDPDLLCVNALYFWEHTPRLFDLFAILRKRGFSRHINLFGFFPTLIFQEILETVMEVNAIAVGEFEHTLVELAAVLEKRGTIETISGLALHGAMGSRGFESRKPEKDPNSFSFPLRTTLKGTISILGSRGCYNHYGDAPL